MTKCAIFILCAASLIVSSEAAYGNFREKRALQNDWLLYVYNATQKCKAEISNKERRQSWVSAPSRNWNNQAQTLGIRSENQNYYEIPNQKKNTPAPVSNSFNRRSSLHENDFNSGQTKLYYTFSTSYIKNIPLPSPSDKDPGYNDFYAQNEEIPLMPSRYDSNQLNYYRETTSHDKGTSPYYDDRRHGYDDKPSPTPLQNHKEKPPYGGDPDRDGSPTHYNDYPTSYDTKLPKLPERRPPNHFVRRSTRYQTNDDWEYRRNHDFSGSRDRSPSPTYYNRPPTYDRGPPPPPTDHYDGPHHHNRGPPPRPGDHPPHDRESLPDYYGRPPFHDRGPPPYHDGGPPPQHGGPPTHDRVPPPDYHGSHPRHERRPPPYHDGSPPYERGPPPVYHGGPPPYDSGPPPGHGEPPPHDRRPPPNHHGGPPPYDRGPPPRHGRPPPHDRELPADHYGDPPRHHKGPPPDNHGGPLSYKREPPPHHGEPPPHDRSPPPPPRDYSQFHERASPSLDRGSLQFDKRRPPSYGGPPDLRESDSSLDKTSLDGRTAPYSDNRPSTPSSSNLAQETRGSTDSGPQYVKLSDLDKNFGYPSNLPTFKQRMTSLPRENIDIRSVTEKEFDIDRRLGIQDAPTKNMQMTHGSLISLVPPLYQVIPVTPETE